MNKERAKVGDMRISSFTKKAEICIGISDSDYMFSSRWEDYETHLLHTRMGMNSDSHEVHTLQYFIDALNANQPIMSEDTIKIRYAYISSLTNVKEDPFYREHLRFRILTLDDLETSHVPLKDLLTLRKTTLIRILGRDLYLNRVDMDGQEIYEHDILRWFSGKDEYGDEEVDIRSHFSEQDTERDCKVICTIYDREDI